MGTMAEKLQAIIDSKAAIKAALESKGLTVSEDFSTYGNLIRSLPVAGVDVTDASDFAFNSHNLPLSATNVQEAVAEICGFLPMLREADADSTTSKVVIKDTKLTLRDNLLLIIRITLPLTGSTTLEFNGTIRPLFNKDGTVAVNVASGASFMAVYNEAKQQWYIL